MVAPVKVLIVDDSIVVRRMLTRILSEDSGIHVVDTAADAFQAEAKIIQHKPDVLTLDIEMPKMDGLTFLKILMQKRPMPVIVMSSLSQEGSAYALKALRLGAVDVFAKPYGPYSVGDIGPQLIAKVKASAQARISRPSVSVESGTPLHKPPKEPLNKPQIPPPTLRNRFHPRQVILLGASTGGTEALHQVISALPAEMPGICIVQHIPPVFSKSFAERLDRYSTLRVKEAQEGDKVLPGRVLIAPGDNHMILQWSTSGYTVSIRKGPPVWHQRPAVDLLFKSAVDIAGKHAIAAILTGMGRDGADGLLALRQKGAQTYGQDEDSCVVYGMPKAAYEIGAVQHVVPLDRMAMALQDALTAKVS